MPHAELKYSADLQIDAARILQLIEDRINAHDPKAGACKGRAYPASDFLHTHMLIEVALLTKPHRDEAFTVGLRADLEATIKSTLTQRCYFSLAITYADAHYITNEFIPT